MSTQKEKLADRRKRRLSSKAPAPKKTLKRVAKPSKPENDDKK